MAGERKWAIWSTDCHNLRHDNGRLPRRPLASRVKPHAVWQPTLKDAPDAGCLTRAMKLELAKPGSPWATCTATHLAPPAPRPLAGHLGCGGRLLFPWPTDKCFAGLDSDGCTLRHGPKEPDYILWDSLGRKPRPGWSILSTVPSSRKLLRRAFRVWSSVRFRSDGKPAIPKGAPPMLAGTVKGWLGGAAVHWW